MIALVASWATRIQRWAAIIGVAVIAFATAYAAGRRTGDRNAKAEGAAEKARTDLKAAQNSLDAVKERHHVETEIARQPDGTSADRLRDEWSRD